MEYITLVFYRDLFLRFCLEDILTTLLYLLMSECDSLHYSIENQEMESYTIESIFVQKRGSGEIVTSVFCG
jgi:hypothetical protein